MKAIAENWAVWQLAKVVNNHAGLIGDADQYERSKVTRECAYDVTGAVLAPNDSSSSRPLDSVFRLVEVEDKVITIIAWRIRESIPARAAVKLVVTRSSVYIVVARSTSTMDLVVVRSTKE